MGNMLDVIVFSRNAGHPVPQKSESVSMGFATLDHLAFDALLREAGVPRRYPVPQAAADYRRKG